MERAQQSAPSRIVTAFLILFLLREFLDLEKKRLFCFSGKKKWECAAFYNRWKPAVRPAITIDTMLMSLMRMLSEGPEVSLKGSPTVSPTTVA